MTKVCTVNFAALQRISKTVPTSVAESTDLLQSPVDDVEALQTAAIEAHTEVKPQKRFVLAAKIDVSDALNGVANLNELVADSNRREAELLANTSMDLDQVKRGAEELRQEQNTVSTSMKWLGILRS